MSGHNSHKFSFFLAGLVMLAGGLLSCGNSVSGPEPLITQVSVVPAGGGTTNWQGIATGWNAEKTVIRITGGNFAPLPEGVASREKPGLLLPRVWLLTSPPTELENILWLDAQNILATVPAGLVPPAGLFQVYGLKVVNPSENEAQVDNAFEVSSLPPPRLGSETNNPYGGGGIFPWAANRSVDITIVTSGENLASTPSIYLFAGGATIPADSVTFFSSRMASAVIPAPDLEIGAYDVILVNPDGQYSTLTAAFSIVGGTAPAPLPASSYPPAGYGKDRENLSIYGQNFVSGTRVFLGQKAAGYPYPGDTAEAEILFSGSSRLDLQLPAGLPSGSYDLIVVNPDGQAGFIPDAYMISATPRPVIFSVSPLGVCGYTPFSITVNGAYFQGDAKVYLAAGSGRVAAQSTISYTPELAVGFFPEPDLTLSDGIYDVIVENPDGEIGVLPQSFFVTSIQCPALTSVYPAFGYTGENTQVTITGVGFESTPEVILAQGTGAEIRLRNVAFISGTSLTAVVPAGVAVGGPYSLTIVNPSGGAVSKPGLFRVTQYPPPKITGINPGTATNGSNTTITVTGSNFQIANAAIQSVDLLNSGLNVAISCGFIVNSNTQVTVNCTTSGMSEGQYLLRITNQENAFGLYASFVLTNSAGKLSLGSAVVSYLNYPRMDFGAAAGQDALGNTFIYAAGGRNGSDHSYSDTIEVAQVDPFGVLGSFKVIPNLMLSRRAGLELVAVPGTQKTYLYAIGGLAVYSTSTYLNTVERAVILSPADAPEITGLSPLIGGNLSAGTWYYRVSAVKNSSDPENPGGETLASEEWTIRVNSGSKITLTWNSTPNTSAYRIYRTASVNGTSFTELRLAETSGTSYTDEGNTSVGSAAPLPAGSCGVWVSSPQGLSIRRAGHSALTTHDPGGSRFLHVIGGTNNGNSGLDDFEYASLDSTGLISSVFQPGASSLVQRRFNHDAVCAGPDNSPLLVGNTRNYIYVMGGYSWGTVGTIEMAQVQNGGELSIWGAPPCVNPCGSDRSNIPNGLQLLLANGYFYTAGGGTIAAPNHSLDQTYMNDPNGSLRNWSAAAEQTITNRFLHEAVISGAYFFFLGGCSSGTATECLTTERSVERILW